jgi:hypothetical protein
MVLSIVSYCASPVNPRGQIELCRDVGIALIGAITSRAFYARRYAPAVQPGSGRSVAPSRAVGDGDHGPPLNQFLQRNLNTAFYLRVERTGSFIQQQIESLTL